MRARWICAVVVLALLVCLICPLAETDPGDNVFQTGNDTESGLALLALCVAATCALARLISVISEHLSVLSCSILAVVCGSVRFLESVELSMIERGEKTRQVTEKIGGASRDRTDDLIVANDGVCQIISLTRLHLAADYGPLRSNSTGSSWSCLKLHSA
jgi:hypothetical protein